MEAENHTLDVSVSRFRGASFLEGLSLWAAATSAYFAGTDVHGGLEHKASTRGAPTGIDGGADGPERGGVVGGGCG